MSLVASDVQKRQPYVLAISRRATHEMGQLSRGTSRRLAKALHCTAMVKAQVTRSGRK